MKDDRLRIPVEDSYVTSLGRAVYAFASLEWNAVYCCDQIKPAYVSRLGKKTADQIADDLIKYAKRVADPGVRAECEACATEFKRLVKRRNDLLHAVPGTAGGGHQRLIRYGRVWTPEDIDDEADAFMACSIALNDVLYHRLAPNDVQ